VTFLFIHSSERPAGPLGVQVSGEVDEGAPDILRGGLMLREIALDLVIGNGETRSWSMPPIS
jgi:hypothetical protein